MAYRDDDEKEGGDLLEGSVAEEAETEDEDAEPASGLGIDEEEKAWE